MTRHQKRLSAPKRWPVERKTETFTVKADAGPHGEAGVPLLVVLRDVLGYADSRKEARYALNQNNVVINGTAVSDEERPVGMFDILAFQEREEYYRVFPGEGGRLALTPIDAEAAQSKLGKIVEKRDVPGGDVQVTLHDGQTLLVEDEAYTPGDSLVVANESDDVVAHFEYEEGALVTAVAGSHAGEIGRIDEIQVTPGSAANNVIASQDDTPGVSGDGFETIAEYIVVIDENFIEGSDEPSDSDADAADSAEADEDEETETEPDVEDADESDDADEETDESESDDEIAADEAEETVAYDEVEETETEADDEDADVDADDESEANDDEEAAEEDSEASDGDDSEDDQGGDEQ
jgi:small subunit ribosomal protein S4e